MPVPFLFSTVTANRGSFAASAGAFLYVVDNTGAANANGLAVTWGSGGGAAATPTFNGSMHGGQF